MWDVCWTEWHWDGFFLEFFAFSLISIISPLLNTRIIWRWDNGPVSGRISTEKYTSPFAIITIIADGNKCGVEVFEVYHSG
jgi:hypothetical protein